MKVPAVGIEYVDVFTGLAAVAEGQDAVPVVENEQGPLVGDGGNRGQALPGVRLVVVAKAHLRHLQGNDGA
jgi:hypothetical protein